MFTLLLIILTSAYSHTDDHFIEPSYPWFDLTTLQFKLYLNKYFTITPHYVTDCYMTGDEFVSQQHKDTKKGEEGTKISTTFTKKSITYVPIHIVNTFSVIHDEIKDCNLDVKGNFIMINKEWLGNLSMVKHLSTERQNILQELYLNAHNNVRECCMSDGLDHNIKPSMPQVNP